MSEYVNFLGIVLVYFLVVYLTAIRRGGQPMLPWIFLILLQAASLYYYEYAYEYVRNLPFLLQQPQIVCQGVTIGALVVVNILMILLLNLTTADRKKGADSQEFTLSSEEIPPITTIEQNPAFRQETQQEDWQIGIAPEESTETSANLNLDDETIFKTIASLIDGGNQEAAIKYLRMVVFFGKNDVLISRAKEMLETLQKRSETA